MRDDIEKFSYVMDFRGPGGERRRVETAPGTSDVTLFLALGKWIVRAEAYYDGTPVGTGEIGFTVSARNNNVEIPMRLPEGGQFWSAVDYEDFGEDDFAHGVPIKRLTVSDKESWDKALAEDITSAGNYVINLDGGFDLNGLHYSEWSFGDEFGITVSLRGAHHTISLADSMTGSLLRVKEGQTLILRDLTLKGHDDNDAPLVYVDGTISSLTMYAGAKIKDNINTSNTVYGGGVSFNDGSFIMEGGEISGNTTSFGGGSGVLFGNGDFTMKGGEISGNTANGNSGGGGVSFGGGSFIMEGGKISGNASSGGGGVYGSSVSCSFIMRGGEISGNTGGLGGGVRITGSFSKTGDSIIYGDTKTTHTPGSIENTSADSTGTGGHAALMGLYTFYYRNATLNAGDDISPSDELPTSPDQTLGYWTMRP
jgi:hypothetical protein